MGPDEPVHYSDSKEVVGASVSGPPTLPAAAKAPVQLHVFSDKQVMLSHDLELGPHLVESIRDVIERSGGKLTNDLSHADMFICSYREGHGYRTASRLNKDVGSLSWLYHLMTFNTWTSPLRRLLHYPAVRGGIPAFRGKKISLSNYVGEARVYLESLIKAAGAECTKTLNTDNTHLITAHGNSEKCAAAKEWGLDVVNHLWLEESYAKWRMLPVSCPRYTHFPRRTNLSEIVGQTRLDRTVLENLFLSSSMEERSSSPPASSYSRSPSPSRRAMRNKNQNVTAAAAAASAVPASSAVSNLMLPPPSKSTYVAGDDTPRAAVESRRLATPARGGAIGDGKENDTPSSTSSRKSKDTAAARLHSLVPDIALYEREKKRVGGVLYGGMKKGSHDEATSKRRSPEPEPTSDSEETTAAKKHKKTKTAVEIRLMITGYPRWLGNMKKEDSDKVSAAM